MLLLQCSFTAWKIAALVSLLMVSILLRAPSRSHFNIAAAAPMEAKPDQDTILESSRADIESERQLFELPSPFDFVNGQCAQACGSHEKQGEEPQVNPCPKVRNSNVAKRGIFRVHRMQCVDQSEI